VALALPGLVACAHANVPHLDAADPVEAALINAKSGNTLVRCEPTDAELAVDGVVRGLASDFDGSVRLLALPAGGHHEVRLRHPGYEPMAVDVVVDAGGGRQTLDVRLTPMQASSQAPWQDSSPVNVQ
jgi:hypothetical protein